MGMRRCFYDLPRSADQVLCGLDTETLLLDKNLSDGTAERLLRPSFPDVIFIKENSPMGLSETSTSSRNVLGEIHAFLNPEPVTDPAASAGGPLDYLDQHLDARCSPAS